jgi:hypothetical protein
MSRLVKTERNLELLRQIEPAFKEWMNDLHVPVDEPMRIALECVIDNAIRTLELLKDTLERVTKEKSDA